MSATDSELNRVVNALSTTLRDQRPRELDAQRCQAIADGALGGERKLLVRTDGPISGSVISADGGERVATIVLEDGQWLVTRDVDASGSRWAVPSG